jgi:hypothetical protein
LTASDGAAGDFFGTSVAISGSTAVVGAPDKNSNTGEAYVFVRSSGKWSQQAQLTAPHAAGGLFGTSVAISGSTAVIGAPFKNSGTGEAYVFAHTSTGWHQRAKLTESPGAMGDLFGFAVAISGSTAVVSAEQTNSDTGAAYVFVKSAGVWSQQAELTAFDAAVGDAFGNSVAISGSTAVIGDQAEGGHVVGAAYVFMRTSGNWSQQAKLTAADGAAGDAFGSSVAISGSTAVIGASGKNSGTGAAYEFVRTSGAWEQQPELTHGASGDRFGSSVGIFKSTAVTGAPGNNSNTGAAYVFVLPPATATGTWSRAWGKGVNGGSKFGICTVAAHCQAGSTGSLGGEMSGPGAVATDSAGNVYVVDTGNNRIEEFDSSGDWLRAWGKGVNGGSKFGICTVAAHCHRGSKGGLGGAMFSPRGVATDTAGNIYVADGANDRIQKFDSSGNWIAAWGKGVNGGSKFGICTVASHCHTGSAGGLGGAINLAQGVATNKAGDVYVADADNSRIQEFDSKGHWLRAFGADVGGSGVDICTVAAHCHKGSGGGLGGEMDFPDGVAVSKAGNVYVSDYYGNRIQEFDSSGNWLLAFGDDVGGTGVDICTVAASCQTGSYGGLGGEMSGPADVATDKAGDVYVADTGNNRIEKFDSSGNWLLAFGADVGGSGVDICTVAASCQTGSDGSLGGEMTPTGIGTDTTGDVYVTEQANNRIEKFH